MRGVAVAAAARYLEERSSDLLLLGITGHAEAVVEIALAQQLVGNLDLRWGRLTRVGRGLVVRPSRCSLPGGLDGRSYDRCSRFDLREEQNPCSTRPIGGRGHAWLVDGREGEGGTWAAGDAADAARGCDAMRSACPSTLTAFALGNRVFDLVAAWEIAPNDRKG